MTILSRPINSNPLINQSFPINDVSKERQHAPEEYIYVYIYVYIYIYIYIYIHTFLPYLYTMG